MKDPQITQITQILVPEGPNERGDSTELAEAKVRSAWEQHLWWPSRMGLSDLSRRDNRTQPGVLTPGTNRKTVRPKGAVEEMLSIGRRTRSGTICLPPFSSFVPDSRTTADKQGESSMWACFLGLKPQAESCYPFGTSPTSPEGTV